MARFDNCLLFHSGISLLKLMQILKPNFTTQRRNDAKNRGFFLAAGHHAAILQPPPIIAGLPSAVAWSHPTAEGVPSTAEGRQSAIGWVPSVTAWVHSAVAWLHSTTEGVHSIVEGGQSIVARRLAIAKRRQSALIHAIFAKNSQFYRFNAKTQRSQDAEPDVSLRLHAFAPLR